jgi:hypothetical protein
VFERYTEKARRAIFFSRYEASHYGSPSIEAEHILLGIFRESHELMKLFPAGSADAIRKEIDARSPIRPGVPTSVDLPLGNESRRVLTYAAEEAERLAHRHIGTEHLLLGLLREHGCFAAEILRQRGMDLAILRGRLGKPSRPILPWGSWGSAIHQARTEPRGTPQDTVEIHGALWDVDYLRDAVRKCRGHYWKRSSWSAPDVAIHRETGKTSFDVGLVDNLQAFNLVKGGWKQEQCAICRWELLESKDQPDRSSGYTNGRDWVCVECYQKFLEGPDYFASSHSEIT